MTTINVTAAVIADAMGVLLLACAAAGTLFTYKEKTKRERYLLLLAIVTALSCTFDAICVVADGKTAPIAYYLVHWCNTLSYICGVVTAIAWILIIAEYIKVRLSRFRRIVLASFFCVVMLLIIANIFTPILFRVNENNNYERVDKYFYIYSLCYFGFIFDGIAMYVWKRHKSGGLKFFPLWAYAVPMAFGMIIQNAFFGVSTIAPFTAIAVTTMAISFRNNIFYRDQLTDLYNRYYLSMLEKKIKKRVKKEYTVLMLDINDFKSINDRWGHSVGDQALKQMAHALISTVDKAGEIIRYAGDEFIIIVNFRDDAFVRGLVERIHQSLTSINEAESALYKLTVSIGWCKFCIDDKSLYDAISEADKQMYQSKERYYKAQELR